MGTALRLTLLAHGPTIRARDTLFGDLSDLAAPPARLPGVQAGMFSAPEPACRQTADALLAGRGTDTPVVVLDGLRQPDYGSWAGLSYAEVSVQDPGGLEEWLRDPAAAPHGGESLAAHAARVAGVLDDLALANRTAIVVVTPATLRAACVHALDAGSGALHHLEARPGASARLNRTARWRLSALLPPARTG
ncbi:MAG: histidine phosphatase family protein [Micropruina sp.]|nr:histidine phosphatase family protein [Micropruina sp.]